MRVIVFILISYCLQLLNVAAQEEPGRVHEKLLKAIVKIKTPLNQNGTGFLISKEVVVSKDTSRVIFLVTNKHVIGDWNPADANIKNYHNDVEVYFYSKNPLLPYTPTKVALMDSVGNPKKYKFLLHPKPEIDVVIINIGEDISKSNKIDLWSFDSDYLLPFDRIKIWQTGLGDQVFTLGYPLGITSLKNNYPIVKSGYVASVPGEEFSIDVPALNRQNRKTQTRLQGKILLVDGLIVGGNSGGPVILPSELLIKRDPKTNQILFGSKMIKNYIIGIVSISLGHSGLTVCFSSDYISELIDLYLKSKI